MAHQGQVKTSKQQHQQQRPSWEDSVKNKNTWCIGSSRYVDIDENNEVTIRDEENIVKHAVFTDKRWVKFSEQVPYIDSAIRRDITLKPTDFRVHTGGNWYIMVTDERSDIRRFYINSQDNIPCATPVAIALTFVQWNTLKMVIDETKEELEDVESCWHLSQRDMERCRECTPMPSSSS